MNLVRIFALLTSLSAVEGSIQDRSLISDGPATACDFNEDETVSGPFPSVFGDDFYTICDDLDVFIGQANATRQNNEPIDRPEEAADPQLGEGFIHFATWENGNKENTLQCFYAKGYSKTEEYLGQGNCVEDCDEDCCIEKYRLTIHGHYLAALFATDYFNGTNPNDLKTPGTYWMRGGTFQYEIDDFGDWNITKATGSYYDVCAAIAESSVQDCEQFTKEKKCTKNGCEWNAVTDECGEPTGEQDCEQFTKKGKCKKNGCEWDTDTDKCGEPSGDAVASAKQSVGKAAAVKEPMGSSHSAGAKARALARTMMMIAMVLIQLKL